MAKRLEKGQKLGPYTVSRFIGRGGMGEVYEAFEERLARRVALKVISPRKGEVEGKIVDRFMAEAKSLAQVHHQNVVSIFAIDEVEDRKYIAMEYIEGHPIDQLRKRFVFDAFDATHLLFQMLEGLKALHDKNIIHRDIKPGNIILQKDGRMKFIDFGLAKSLESNDDTEATGEFYGTPRYLAPEVAAGSPSHTGSDIFCLGLVFYELFSGERLIDPKGEWNPLTVIGSYENFKFKTTGASKRLMGPRLYKIIVGMLQPKPHNRYTTCDEVLKLIKPLVRESRRPGDPFFEKVCANHTNFKAIYKHLNEDLQYDPFSTKRILTITLGFPDVHLTASDSDDTDDLSSGAQANDYTFEKVKIESAQKKFESFYEPNVIIETENLKQAPAAPAVRITAKESAPKIRATFFKKFLMGAIVVIVMAGFSQTKWGKGLLASKIGRKLASMGVMSPVVSLPTEAGPQGVMVWTDDKGVLSEQFEWPRDFHASELATLELARDMNFRRIDHAQPVSGVRTQGFSVEKPGHYFWRVVVGGSPVFGPFQIWADTPEAPVLLSPKDGAEYSGSRRTSDTLTHTVNFYWRKKRVARDYQFQVSASQNFSTQVVNKTVSGLQTHKETLPVGKYFWRMKVVSDQEMNWGEVRSFTIR
ncbi:MAG: serine/threonine protein kinase [Bdellovibrionales bacterium]|nr:serine/threonine protein kinase [Bdellovibrionales bacterium]